MKGIQYQLKSIVRDKMCILTFLLPVIVGLAINLLSGVNLSTLSENTFGVVRDNFPAETVEWIQTYGSVTIFENKSDLIDGVNNPSTQMIGVTKGDAGIEIMLSGDELEITTTVGNSLSKIYGERSLIENVNMTISPAEGSSDDLRSLLIVITLATAMFMGGTFNAMNIISEKEDGIVFINEVLPMSKGEYVLQKTIVGYIFGVLSTGLTACICMRVYGIQILYLCLIIVLSTYIAALTGLFIGKFSSGLMAGIVYIKFVMILFIAPPVLFYLVIPENGIAHTLSYLLPSSAAFYGLMDLLNRQTGKVAIYLIVLLLHSIFLLAVYLLLECRKKH